MSGSFLNLVIDDSASMGRVGIGAARQAAVQLLQYVASRDRQTGETTPCSAWTFSDEPVAFGLMLPARELLQIPLVGHGASMLGRALRAVAETSEANIAAEQRRSRTRGERSARTCTILIGDLEASDEWMLDAQRLAKLGRIGLVLVERGPLSTPPDHESFVAFHASVHAHHLGQRQIEALIPA
jgi:uncharacterized protein YegL